MMRLMTMGSRVSATTRVILSMNTILGAKKQALRFWAKPRPMRQLFGSWIFLFPFKGQNLYREVRSTNSSSDHSRSLTRASIAGVTRKVRCTRTKL